MNLMGEKAISQDLVRSLETSLFTSVLQEQGASLAITLVFYAETTCDQICPMLRTVLTIPFFFTTRYLSAVAFCAVTRKGPLLLAN